MDDHDVAGATSRGEFQEYCQGQADLFTVRDNRLIIVASLPACVPENQVGAADPVEHPTDATRGLVCCGVVEKVGIEASSKLEVVGSGTQTARDVFVYVGSYDTRNR